MERRRKDADAEARAEKERRGKQDVADQGALLISFVCALIFCLLIYSFVRMARHRARRGDDRVEPRQGTNQGGG